MCSEAQQSIHADGLGSPLCIEARDKNAKIQCYQEPTGSERIMRNQPFSDERKITLKDKHDFITLLPLFKNDAGVLITDELTNCRIFQAGTS